MGWMGHGPWRPSPTRRPGMPCRGRSRTARRSSSRSQTSSSSAPRDMTRLLDSIDRPQDLHSLSENELEQVAQEIRELLIDTVGEIGGHFGANLGACEIAVAVHSLLD